MDGSCPAFQYKQVLSTSKLYKNETSKVMPRNRFQILLRMLHFCNNKGADQTNRLYKVQGVIDLLDYKYQSALNPEKDISIDETMIPFRGRVIFRRYLPNKAHKYGIKLFKLCIEKGYTWKFQVYQGKMRRNPDYRLVGVAQRVVMYLVEPLLNNGRTVYVDNWYSSVSLAHA